MHQHLNAPMLAIHRDLAGKTIAGIQLQRILSEIESAGFTILRGGTLQEGCIVAEAHRGLSCILVSGEWDEARKTAASDLVQLVKVTRSRAPNLPIFVMGERVTYEFSHVPAEALGDVRVMYLFEDTVPFLARQIMREANEYLDRLLPPYFKALVKHSTESAYSWHTPGHGGGVKGEGGEEEEKDDAVVGAEAFAPEENGVKGAEAVENHGEQEEMPVSKPSHEG